MNSNIPNVPLDAFKMDAFKPCGSGNIASTLSVAQLSQCKLWVGDIPRHVTSQMLHNEFDHFCDRYNPASTILEATVQSDRNRLYSLGYGWIIFSDPKSSKRALNSKVKIEGQWLTIRNGFDSRRDTKYYNTNLKYGKFMQMNPLNTMQNNAKLTINIQTIEPIDIDKGLTNLKNENLHSNTPIHTTTATQTQQTTTEPKLLATAFVVGELPPTQHQSQIQIPVANVINAGNEGWRTYSTSTANTNTNPNSNSHFTTKLDANVKEFIPNSGTDAQDTGSVSGSIISSGSSSSILSDETIENVESIQNGKFDRSNLSPKSQTSSKSAFRSENSSKANSPFYVKYDSNHQNWGTQNHYNVVRTNGGYYSNNNNNNNYDHKTRENQGIFGRNLDRNYDENPRIYKKSMFKPSKWLKKASKKERMVKSKSKSKTRTTIARQTQTGVVDVEAVSDEKIDESNYEFEAKWQALECDKERLDLNLLYTDLIGPFTNGRQSEDIICDTYSRLTKILMNRGLFGYPDIFNSSKFCEQCKLKEIDFSNVINYTAL